MRLDASEWTGNGVAFGLHVALVAALSLSLARPSIPVESAPVFVEFVDEIGLESAAPVPDSAEARQALTTDRDPLPDVDAQRDLVEGR